MSLAGQAHAQERGKNLAEMVEDSGDFPSLRDARAVFKAMGSSSIRSGPLDGALLACRASTTDDTLDDFSAPDLRIEMVLNGSRTVEVNGPEDEYAMYFSAPMVSLSPGDTVSFELWDRDVFSDDFAGSGSTTYQGVMPFRIKGPKCVVECRAWKHSRVEAELTQRMKTFDHALKKVRKLKDSTRLPDFGEEDWGAAGLGWTSVDEAIDDLAGLVGRNDPRVSACSKQSDDALNEWRANVAHLAQKQAKPLGDSLKVNRNLKLKELSWQCGKISPSSWEDCQLQTTFVADVPWSLNRTFDVLTGVVGPSLPSIFLIDESGQTIGVSDAVAISASGQPLDQQVVSLRKGEPLTLRWKPFTGDALKQMSSTPQVMVMNTDTRSLLVKLPEIDAPSAINAP